MRSLPALVAALGLSACTTPPKHTVPAASNVALAADSQPDAAHAPEATLPAEAPRTIEAEGEQAPTAASAAGFWAQLRAGLRFVDCTPEPLRARWEHIYAGNPQRFEQLLQPVLPELELVANEVERRQLPTEFALLPIVESRYLPVRNREDAVAGIWQIAPQTARSFGLRIEREYDARLDLSASTHAALDLIEHLQREFPQDWRLADLAFNAGEFRVQRAIASNRRGNKSTDPAHLNLSRISHEHLAKLEALACIVRDPQQFDVTLREPDPSQSLVALPIDRALDFELIARLSGLSMGRLRSLNAGWLRQRIGAGGGVLLLPLAHAEKFGAAYAQLPPSLRADFVFAKLHSTMHWSDIAGNSGAPAPLLADINGRKSDAPAPAGARLYLPALLLAAIPATAEPVVVAHDRTERPASYRVRAGDSLWTIAKRFELRVGQLCEWNALSPKATLRLGQEIALGPGR